MTLVTFIMNVYASMWFCIKKYPTLMDGSRHVISMIQRSSYLPTKLRDIVLRVISRDAYFKQPENILLCRLADANPDLHEERKSEIQTFVVPMDAKYVSKLVNWTKV